MSSALTLRKLHRVRISTEGWLMSLAHLLGQRLARPQFLHTGELSAHLLRDIGLEDSRRR